MVMIAIPTLVLGFVVVGRHYADVRTRLRDPGGAHGVVRGPVVLYVSALDDAAAAALRYVRAIAGDRYQAIHVADPAGVTGIAQAWRGFSDGGPAARRAAARADGLRHGRPLRPRPRARPRRGHDPGRARAVPAAVAARASCAAGRRSRCACACRASRTSSSPTCRSWPTRRASAGRGRARAARASCCRSRSSTPPRAMPCRYALGLGERARHRAARRARGRRRRADAARPGRPAICRFRSRSWPRPTATSGSRCWPRSARSRPIPDAVCVVVMPEIISPHRWQRLLHNQRALFIKRLLLFEERVVLTSVPYRLPEAGESAPRPADGARGSRTRGPRVPAQGAPARRAGVAVERAAARAVRAAAAPLDRGDLARVRGLRRVDGAARRHARRPARCCATA